MPRPAARPNRSPSRRGVHARQDFRARADAAGLHYDPGFVSAQDRAEIVRWLGTIRPLWENRFRERDAQAAGGQRRLLRPVYWLGNWQFACLDYYRPPHGTRDRCMRAEPYPPVLARLVARIEQLARGMYSGRDLPHAWTLNTCLVNLYGDRLEGERRIDCARVGEHRDFEPGPVASISLGERALFEFVTRGGRDAPARLLRRIWLSDGSLLLFGGDTWKRRSLHRVLRVERRTAARFELHVPSFETRRINFTFRYVPERDIATFAELSAAARNDVRTYVEELAHSSPFFARALADADVRA